MIASPNKPFLSLIVAVYQQAAFLERVFESLLNQTFTDFEIVVADDGSGPEIAHTIGRYDGRFRNPIRHVRHDDDGFRKTVVAVRRVGVVAAGRRRA